MMNTTWVFTINKDDEQLLNKAKKETGISADHRPSVGRGYNEAMLTIWCEDDDVGCILMSRFLELRGEGDINFNDDCEAFTKRRLRTVL
jgi:hypothetical protein